MPHDKILSASVSVFQRERGETQLNDPVVHLQMNEKGTLVWHFSISPTVLSQLVESGKRALKEIDRLQKQADRLTQRRNKREAAKQPRA